MPELDLKKSFTTGDVAHILGITSQTVVTMFDSGTIKGFKLPKGDRRIPRGDLINYLRSIDNTDALREIGE